MKDTRTTWTCDRCGATAETTLPPFVGGVGGIGQVPPMPADWRDITPQATIITLCKNCCADLVNWAAHPANQTLKKGA